MELSYTTFASNLSQPIVLFGIILLLSLYALASRRVRILPPLPLALLILYLCFRLILQLLPEDFSPKLLHGIDLISIIFLFAACARLLFAFTIDYRFTFRRESAIPKLTRDFILFAVYAVITFAVLHSMSNINIAGLITTSAVLTAIIGLAAQNTLGNLFAGLSLQLERPYSIGDWISFGDQSGLVVGIGWKSTRIKTFEEELVFVPNLDIANSVLKNFSRPTRRHIMNIDIGIEYGAAPNAVREVLLEALREEPHVLREPAPQVRVMEYGDFAITYHLRFFYKDYGVSPTLRASIMNRIWYALRRANIRIPFPIRDVQHRHIERAFESRELSAMRTLASAALDAVPILTPLSQQSRETIADRMRIETYGHGETIVRQGEEGSSLYILHHGACEVWVKKGEGAPIKVASLSPPAFFGEMSLLTGEPRSATVRADGDTTLFVIDKALFREILLQEPSVHDELAAVIAKRQAENLEALKGGAPSTDVQTSKMLRRIKAFFGLS